MAAEHYPSLLFRINTLFVSKAAKAAMLDSSILGMVLFSHASGDFSGAPPEIEAHNYATVQARSGVVLNKVHWHREDYEVATSLPDGLTYIRLWSEPEVNPATHLANFQTVPQLREQFPAQPPKATP